jgi:hypothetical protein
MRIATVPTIPVLKPADRSCRLAFGTRNADDAEMQRGVVVVFGRDRGQCGAAVGNLDLWKRRRYRRFNQEGGSASFLRVPNELVSVEVGAS